MNNSTMVAATFTALLAGTSLAWAEDVSSPRVDARQDRQQARIIDGLADDELTGVEARHLAREQVRINRTERRLEADGALSARDRAVLEKKQDRASRHIYRTKHNARTSAR